MKTPGNCAFCGTPLVPGHHCESGRRLDVLTFADAVIAAAREVVYDGGGSARLKEAVEKYDAECERIRKAWAK